MEPGTVYGVKDTLLPCPPEAFDTLQRISNIAPASKVSVSANCMIDVNDNTIKGWHCLLPPDTPIHCVPFQPNMFEGITVVETFATENQILDMLKNRSGTMKKLQSLAQRLQSSNVQNRSSWQRCRPDRSLPLQKTRTWHVVMKSDNLARYTKVEGSKVTVANDAPLDMIPDDTTPNYLDSATWDPELGVGGFVGLYHQWYSSSDGTQKLKMYIVCQSSCQKAGLEIKQLINDIPHHTNIADIVASEEIWWLSNLNMRNRNRLIWQVAKHLGIPIPCIEDYHAADNKTMMAEPTTHSFLYALYAHRSGEVSVVNECIPTMLVNNGIVCRMAPWEGVWIFNGPHINEAQKFGTAFGNSSDVFPLTAVKLNEHTDAIARHRRYIVQRSRVADHPFWIHANDRSTTPTRQNIGTDKTVDKQKHDDSVDVSDSSVEIDINGFQGVNDPDLYALALEAWKRAQTTAIRQQKHAQNAKTTGVSSVACKSGDADGSESYISFDDTVVLNKLQKVNWDPRFGVLKLIPLCLVTN
eukprot:3933610-Rhodomonas_salina.3